MNHAEADQIRRQAFALAASNLEFYAPRHLFITDKITRARQPFTFNAPQRILHAAAEHQLAERNYVRLICVKARQQGISTYITGRGYWRTTLRRNYNTVILTHELKATKNLFKMVQGYHDACPPAMRPRATEDAANQLTFGEIGSSYSLGTARSRATGRSLNAQFFHGSEVAFWPGLEDNLAGLGQAIALAPGTEIFLESTANGRNEYYNMAMMALRGRTPYGLVFIPWFVTPEYQMPQIPRDFDLSEDDADYQDTYELSLKQMAWRQFKIEGEFGGDSTLFDQEYPASLARAFKRSSTEDPFIRTKTTEQARKRTTKPQGPKRMGVDPSEGSSKSDRFAVVIRDDTGVRHKIKVPLKTDDQYEAAGAVLALIREHEPDVVFIDRLGIGAGICDIVAKTAGATRVIGVKASEAARDRRKYANMRAEMWGETRDWLIQGAELLDDDELESDLNIPGYKYRGEAYLIETKESIKKRKLPSPDFGDALAATFYLPFELAQNMSADQLRSGGAAQATDWRAM